MKKRIILLTVAITIVIVLTASFSVYYSTQFGSNSQTRILPKEEPPNWQIKVTGDVAQEKTLTLQEISQMPLTNVTVKVNGENVTYYGVPLYDFCNQTSINWDAGAIDVISASGNKASINIYQAYNSSMYPYYYNQNVITLAFIKDGKWLTNQTGGSAKLVAPYFPAEDQVENVAEIHIRDYTVSISGAVENPIVITGKNLTLFQPKTVHAEFAPSEKRTSDWTGLPILDILQAANMSSRAEKITVIAIDGYEKNYTLDQVADGQMMLGYLENGSRLPHSQGGPFRLFAPTEQYKWAQYWVKFVSEIMVS